MDAESFTALCLRVVSREATGEERRLLHTELTVHPERLEEFNQIRAAHDMLRTAAPMLEARRATGPELPAYRLNELKTAVRQHFGPATSSNPVRQVSGFAGLRWLFAGGGTLLAVAMVMIFLSARSVEIGLYKTDLVRGGAALSAQDINVGHVVTFDQDATFDQWQKQPPAWYQRAKIWVDNEQDILVIVTPNAQGTVTVQTQPLAPTVEGQREQIRKTVEGLKR